MNKKGERYDSLVIKIPVVHNHFRDHDRSRWGGIRSFRTFGVIAKSFQADSMIEQLLADKNNSAL